MNLQSDTVYRLVISTWHQILNMSPHFQLKTYMIQVWVLSHGVGLKSIQTLIGYSSNLCTCTTALVYILGSSLS